MVDDDSRDPLPYGAACLRAALHEAMCVTDGDCGILPASYG